MSHQPERNEKNCLNCATIVHGRYCHACGQENIVTHQNFSSLARHFIYDIFHFDGKFFETLRRLFTNPGSVAKGFVSGKRQSYLDPIRMYLFTSALVFLIVFSFGDFKVQVNTGNTLRLNKGERLEAASTLYTQLKNNPGDSLVQHQIDNLFDTTKQIRLTPVTKGDTVSQLYYKGKKYSFYVEKDNFKTLTANTSNSWFKQKLSAKVEDFKEKHKYNYAEGANQLMSIFVHRLPYLFFISLPFFAGILHLINIRRKNFFYSDHAVFTLYLYIFTFIVFLFYFAFDSIGKKSGYVIFNWIGSILMIIWPIHFFISLKRFYSLSFGKAMVKFILINFLAMTVLILLFALFFLLSLFI